MNKFKGNGFEFENITGTEITEFILLGSHCTNVGKRRALYLALHIEFNLLVKKACFIGRGAVTLKCTCQKVFNIYICFLPF